jgi:hypothetical protein
MRTESHYVKSAKSPAIFWLVSLLALAWLVGGCASTSSGSSAPKPGSGIAEYRDVTRTARGAVAAVVKSLEALDQPHTGTSLQHPALPGFDRALHHLELTSVKTRARAEAIIARGQSYFEEWKENLSGITNRAVAQAEAQRYARLREHFERVRQRSGEVRDEFRPFMAKLREFRARLDKPGTAAGGESTRQELDGLTAGGRRVLETLDSVTNALNEAEAELHATLASKP